jgi:hypothetical protein
LRVVVALAFVAAAAFAAYAMYLERPHLFGERLGALAPPEPSASLVPTQPPATTAPSAAPSASDTPNALRDESEPLRATPGRAAAAPAPALPVEAAPERRARAPHEAWTRDEAGENHGAGNADTHSGAIVYPETQPLPDLPPPEP